VYFQPPRRFPLQDKRRETRMTGISLYPPPSHIVTIITTTGPGPRPRERRQLLQERVRAKHDEVLLYTPTFSPPRRFSRYFAAPSRAGFRSYIVHCTCFRAAHTGLIYPAVFRFSCCAKVFPCDRYVLACFPPTPVKYSLSTFTIYTHIHICILRSWSRAARPEKDRASKRF